MMTDEPRRRVIVSFALVGGTVDAGYRAPLGQDFTDPPLEGLIRGVVISGIASQSGWGRKWPAQQGSHQDTLHP